MTRKERFGLVDIVIADQNVFAVALDKGSAAGLTDGVRDPGADEIADRPEDNYPPEIHVTGDAGDCRTGGECAAKAHDGFARDRNTG